MTAGPLREARHRLRAWFGVAFVLCLAWVSAARAAEPATDEQVEGKSFCVFGDDPAFGAKVAAWADAYLAGIPPRFGFDREPAAPRAPLPPWAGPTKGTITLHESRDAFVRATGAPAWAGGVAKGFRGIHAFVDAEALSVEWQQKKLLDRTLPHELAHHLFREYLGPAAAGVPRWFHEGVAMAAEANADGEYGRRLRIMGEWLRQGRSFPFDRFRQMTTESLGEADAQLFYSQAATATGFLRLIYGTRRFLPFLASLREGTPFADALGAATGGKIASLGDFEAGWRSYVLKSTEGARARSLRSQPVPAALRVAALLPEGTPGDLGAVVGRRILVIQWFSDLDPPTADELRRLSDLYRREWKRLALVWVHRGDGTEFQRLLAKAGLPAPCPVVADPDGSASAAIRRECGLKKPPRGAAPSGTLLAVLTRRGRLAYDGLYGPAAEAAIEQALDEDASEP